MSVAGPTSTHDHGRLGLRIKRLGIRIPSDAPKNAQFRDLAGITPPVEVGFDPIRGPIEGIKC